MAGADTITGSATTAMVINSGAGNDTIVGGVAADTIVAAAGNDTITTGNGGGSVTGGTGADTIDVTNTISAIDNIVVASGDGSAAGTVAGTFTGYDVVTGFTLAKDTITVTGLANEQNYASTDATNSALDLTDADFANVDKVVAFLNDAATIGDNALNVITVTYSDFSALYLVTDTVAADTLVDATELQSIIYDAVLTTAEVI